MAGGHPIGARRTVRAMAAGDDRPRGPGPATSAPRPRTGEAAGDGGRGPG